MTQKTWVWNRYGAKLMCSPRTSCYSHITTIITISSVFSPLLLQVTSGAESSETNRTICRKGPSWYRETTYRDTEHHWKGTTVVYVSIGIICSLFGNFQYATRSNSDRPFITQFRILLADCRYGNILKRQFYTLTYPIACSSARNLTTNLLCCFGEIWSCDVGLLFYMGRTAVFWVTKIFMPVSIDILSYQIVASLHESSNKVLIYCINRKQKCFCLKKTCFFLDVYYPGTAASFSCNGSFSSNKKNNYVKWNCHLFCLVYYKTLVYNG